MINDGEKLFLFVTQLAQWDENEKEALLSVRHRDKCMYIFQI